jgi:hypothetical protein
MQEVNRPNYMVDHADDLDLLVVYVDQLPLVGLQSVNLLIIAHLDRTDLLQQMPPVFVQRLRLLTLLLPQDVF